MTLTQLRYFVALSDRLHFKQTAELLYISQPSLTQHISKLEKELGVTLFTRNADGLVLTPAGIVVQREAKEILKRLDILERAVKDPSMFASVPSEFRIAVDEYTFYRDSVITEAFVSAMQDLQQTYPYTEFRTESSDPKMEYLRSLRDGTVDLFMGMTEQPRDESLECVCYGSQPQYLAIPGNVPLMRSGNRKRLTEYLNSANLYILDINHRMEIKTRDYLRGKGIEANLKFVSSVPQIILAVRLGKGGGVIPGHHLMSEMFGDIQLVPLDGLDFSRYLVWSNNFNNPVLSRFIERFMAETESRKSLHSEENLFLEKDMLCDW